MCYISDAEFKQFLDDREHPLKVDIPSVEDRVKEIEEKEKMQIGTSAVLFFS